MPKDIPKSGRPEARLTIVHSAQPETAGKWFKAEDDGSIATGTVGWYRTAAAAVVTVDSPAGFAAWIKAAETEGCYCIHAAPPRTSGVFTLDTTGTGGDRVPRTLAHFSRNDGPGFMGIDTDAPFDPTVEGMRGALLDAAPLVADAEFVWIPSASSMIFRGDEEIRGLKGAHGYLGVLDATDIQRAGEVLFDRLILAGHCKLKFSDFGAALMRTPFDRAMLNPVQPDYLAPATCHGGLEQRRGDPVVVNPGGIPFIDSRQALPDLTKAERDEVARVEARMRLDAEPELRKHRAAVGARKRREAVLSDRPDLAGDSEGLAREISRREEAGEFKGVDAMLAGERADLPMSWAITLRDGRRLTVAEILDLGMAVHGEICRDPRNEAYMAGRLHMDGPTPHVWSCASGGAVMPLGTAEERESRREAGLAWLRLRSAALALDPTERRRLFEFLALDAGLPDDAEFAAFAALWEATSPGVRGEFEDMAGQALDRTEEKIDD